MEARFPGLSTTQCDFSFLLMYAWSYSLFLMIGVLSRWRASSVSDLFIALMTPITCSTVENMPERSTCSRLSLFFRNYFSLRKSVLLSTGIIAKLSLCKVSLSPSALNNCSILVLR